MAGPVDRPAPRRPRRLSEMLASGTLSLVPGGSFAVILLEWLRAGHGERWEAWIDRLNGMVPPERLAEALEDPITQATFEQASMAAMATGLEAKRRLLAKVIAQAVLDAAKVDEAS